MNWKNVSTAVEKVAPTVSTILAGPGADALGASIAARLNVAATPEAVMNVLQEKPELMTTLERIELDLNKVILVGRKKRDIKAMRAAAAIEQTDLGSKHFIYWFAAGWSLFTMFYVSMISFSGVPEGSRSFADTVLGFMLGTLIASIIQFFFGSSLKDQVRENHDRIKSDFDDNSGSFRQE